MDLRQSLATVLPLLRETNLEATITTFQGPISVLDYLVTRCVEAVVHGMDLQPPVTPDLVAQDITSTALLDTLNVAARDLVSEARALPIGEWIDLATGRATASGPLAEVLPVMA